ncbi:MAG: NAD(P)/FAD-dependent oxidoreductase [Bacteroidota bacterium]
MRVDFLIIGQGLSGSWLSYECLQAGASVCVIDQFNARSPSQLSAGIINPITGRRHVEVWLVDEILLHAQEAYGALSKQIGQPLLRTLDLLDCFPSEQMSDSFMDRIRKNGRFVKRCDEAEAERLPLNHPFGIGRIEPVMLVDLPAFLNGWKKCLLNKQALREEAFHPDQLIITDDLIQYQEIQADRIIFCDGTSDLSPRFFPTLPYAPNKGEVLILDIPDLPSDHLYKQGLMLAPLSNGLWWAGSSYQWSFDHADPTPVFRASTEQTLRNWLKVPFRVIDHVAGVRPATLERRPFVGMHEEDPRIGILNGMGTRGCSLAPYFALQLVQHLVHGSPIHPDAAVSRFGRP